MTADSAARMEAADHRFADVARVPAYVYRCYGHDGRLVYVGCTINLFGRLTYHRLNSFWAHEVAKVKASVYPHKTTALAAERKAIRDEGPRFNVKGRWQSHVTWTVEQYDDYLQALLAMPGPAAVREKHVKKVRLHRDLLAATS